MFKRLISAALVFGMAANGPPALAQTCAPREVIVERLKNTFDERLSSAGLQSGQPVDLVIEIWSSQNTGTFTILMSHPKGVSCMVASGRDYFTVPSAHGEEDATSSRRP